MCPLGDVKGHRADVKEGGADVKGRGADVKEGRADVTGRGAEVKDGGASLDFSTLLCFFSAQILELGASFLH